MIIKADQVNEVFSSNQSIFDWVAQHLIEQGKPSMAPYLGEMLCTYRGEGGAACAVGCVIPDELYRDSMERSGVEDLFQFVESDYDEEFKETIRGRSRILEALQNAHDDYFDTIEILLDELIDIAHRFDLETYKLESFAAAKDLQRD